MCCVRGTNDHVPPFVWFTAAAFWIRSAGGARKGLGGHVWGVPNYHKIVGTRNGAHDRIKRKQKIFLIFKKEKILLANVLPQW